MAIERINKEKCVGCGTCALSCPMDVIRMNPDENKAEVRYPEDCVMCAICIADCPAGAVEMTPGKPGIYPCAGY